MWENIFGFVVLAAVLYGVYRLYLYLNDRKKSGKVSGGSKPGTRIK